MNPRTGHIDIVIVVVVVSSAIAISVSQHYEVASNMHTHSACKTSCPANFGHECTP